MNTIFSTGVTGMIAYQRKLDTTAQNIANVNTAGYKPSKTSFEDLIYTKMDVNTDTEWPSGHGVKMAGEELDPKQGTMMPTGNPLDFALLGEGFFAVDNGGVTEYTRNGEFRIQLNGGTAYLTAPDGGRVLDGSGNPVVVTNDEKTGLPDYGTVKDKVGVYLFDNPYGLDRAGNGRLLESALSGQPKSADAGGAEPVYKLQSGFLEASAVDIGNEMIGVIEAQRAFQVSAKIVQTADEIEEIVNNLR